MSGITELTHASSQNGMLIDVDMTKAIEWSCLRMATMATVFVYGEVHRWTEESHEQRSVRRRIRSVENKSSDTDACTAKLTERL